MSPCRSYFSLPDGQEQPVADVAEPGLEHALRSELRVDGGGPDVDAGGPLGGGAADTRLGAEDAEDENALGAPLAEGLDGGGAGAAGGDDGVEDDGQGGGRGGRGGVLGEVVVVLDRLEGGRLAVEAEVVDGDRGGEDGLDCCFRGKPGGGVSRQSCRFLNGGREWNAYRLPCPTRIAEWARLISSLERPWWSRTQIPAVFCPVNNVRYCGLALLPRPRPEDKRCLGPLTFGPAAADMAVANASQPTIRAISCTSDLTSFALVLPERSWLSFARKHGWLETWTLSGRDMVTVRVGMLGGMTVK